MSDKINEWSLKDPAQQNKSVSSPSHKMGDSGPLVLISGATNMFRRKPDLLSNAPKKKIFNIECGDAMSGLAASKSSPKLFTNKLSNKYGNTNPTYTGEVYCSIL